MARADRSEQPARDAEQPEDRDDDRDGDEGWPDRRVGAGHRPRRRRHRGADEPEVDRERHALDGNPRQYDADQHPGGAEEQEHASERIHSAIVAAL
jgi:hypothetical protein